MKKSALSGLVCLFASAAISFAGPVNHKSDDNKCPKIDNYQIATFSIDTHVDLSSTGCNDLDFSEKCDHKKPCKIEWKSCDPCDHKCGLEDCGKDHGCKGPSDDCHKHCGGDPADSVPAPASAALGGAGVAGVMLMSFIRGRRVAKA